ncbi:hypothetical protein [Microbacterium sp. NPDC087665]|uniref:hypothetical protein n=1 Tax=Microbacterium sp. NPDC087665 TaxID=3364194 RepID=UPI00381AB1B3
MVTKKTHHWQALTLAALVLAGGTAAVPQPAEAATTSTTCAYSWGTCQVKIKIGGFVHFRVKAVTAPGTKISWTVQASNGRRLCSGTMSPGSSRMCSFNYSGTVTITAYTGVMRTASITAWS